jgi:hypothetical protein
MRQQREIHRQCEADIARRRAQWLALLDARRCRLAGLEIRDPI